MELCYYDTMVLLYYGTMYDGTNDLAQMETTTAWLNALPLSAENCVFFDKVAERYRWIPKRLPNLCVCGKKFDIDHAINCGRGGFKIRRQNEIRDVVAELLDHVAHDVWIEPPLQALTGNEGLSNSANKENEGRLDVAGRGFWERREVERSEGV